MKRLKRCTVFALVVGSMAALTARLWAQAASQNAASSPEVIQYQGPRTSTNQTVATPEPGQTTPHGATTMEQNPSPSATNTVVLAEPPPAPPVEEVPPPPGPDYVWIPGYWTINPLGVWVWVGGHYVVRPRAHVVWVPGRWIPHGHGYVFIRGHWR